MKTSKRGIELIKQFEGCVLRAYKPVNSEKYYTIGYGHYGKDVNRDMVITQEYAEMLLVNDLVQYEKYVNELDYNFNQNEFDALVSFTYNCGKANLYKLTCKGLRSKNVIADKILQYNKSNGRILKGLVKRRKAEQELFKLVD